jgi:hypothetical protein
MGYHPFSSILYAAAEFSEYKDRVLFVPKIGAWAAGGAGGASLGVSFVHYLHTSGQSLKARAEVGFGVFIMRFHYGRYISITNNTFWPVSRNMFGLNFLIPASRKFYSLQQRSVLPLQLFPVFL